MPPKVAQAIMETEPGRQLAKYLYETMQSLDRTSDIEPGDPMVVAVEVRARNLALDKLSAILSTLMQNDKSTGSGIVGGHRDDYSVNV